MKVQARVVYDLGLRQPEPKIDKFMSISSGGFLKASSLLSGLLYAEEDAKMTTQIGIGP